MQIQITPIYKKNNYFERNSKKIRRLKKITIILALALFIAPISHLSGYDVNAPYEQSFAITAYYSPLPGQCCYVKGGIDADKILNGDGHTAADDTAVYPGLIAAPPTYPFGTVITLPGYGTFKIHDRGGAIQEWDNGKHRLDLWVGFGEDGLARALQLGIKDVKGTVYLPGTLHPPIDFNFDTLSAPENQLKRFIVNENLLNLKPTFNQTGLSVRMFQEHLHDLGYLQDSPTGFYGENTKNAYQHFLNDYHLNTSAEVLTTEAAAHLLAAINRKNFTSPLSAQVNKNSSAKEITEAQRLLRYLGYYKGRINGKYSDALFNAILSFQQKEKLVGTVNDLGAGQIGPLTTKALVADWNQEIVKSKAKQYEVYAVVDKTLQDRDWLVDTFVSEGNYGPSVLTLQLTLAELGFFKKSEANGNFGPLTKSAVTEYQLSRSIISTTADSSAGVVGPQTLRSLQKEQRSKHFKIAFGQGLQAL